MLSMAGHHAANTVTVRVAFRVVVGRKGWRKPRQLFSFKVIWHPSPVLNFMPECSHVTSDPNISAFGSMGEPTENVSGDVEQANSLAPSGIGTEIVFVLLPPASLSSVTEITVS